MSAIRAGRLAKRFVGADGRELSVLRDLDLTVGDGEFLCILGPSGCGKSTLLNILAGLDRGFTGTMERAPGRVGYLFQEPRLLPWLTADGNLDFALRSCKVPPERWEGLKARYLAMAGLSSNRGFYPHQISGGMAQRLALVRALCVEPGILFMDEPFSGLDEITARRIRLDLLAIWRETRKTVVFVTHNAYEACFLADRILVMSGGNFREEIPVAIPRPRSYDDPAIFELSREVIRVLGTDGDPPAPAASPAADATPDLFHHAALQTGA